MKINKCEHCGNETSNEKFCSRSCAAKQNNKIPKRKKKDKICSKCDNIISGRSTLCEHHRQEFKDKTETIKNTMTLADYTNRDSVKRLHKSSMFAYIRGLCRSWNKNKTKLPCYICGYDKHVELAHIKPISSFAPDTLLKDINSSDNIVQLCPNCHWEFDNGLISLAFPEQL